MEEFLLPVENVKTLIPLQDSYLELEVPYTFGKHTLKVTSFQGQLKLNSAKKELIAGNISLDIEKFETKDKTLLCHFLESMTLDYQVASFPEKQVCENDKLPIEGKNAPRFRTISASLVNSAGLSDPSIILKWSIHGVEKDYAIPVQMSWDTQENIFNLSSRWKMKRSDYNIIVKKFLFINASDEISLKLKLKESL